MVSSYGNVEIVRILVKHGADVAARTNNGWTPLHCASSCEQGADTTAQADNGWTPLHVASYCGSAEVARFIIERGADATTLAYDGRTPLSVAAEVGNVEVFRILVVQGTDKTRTRPPTQGNHLLYLCFFFFLEIYLYFT